MFRSAAAVAALGAAAVAAEDACFAEMTALCGGSDSSLGLVCQRCLIAKQNSLIMPGKCTAQQFGEYFLPFCRCYCHPACDAALLKSCKVPAAPADIQACSSCVVGAAANLLGAQNCSVDNLAVHCSVLGRTSALTVAAVAPAPAPSGAPDACLSALGTACGGLRPESCRGCVISQGVPQCSAGQAAAFCSCGCTQSCFDALTQRCSVPWEDDQSVQVRQCLRCTLDPANSAALAGAGCTADMQGRYCGSLPEATTPTPTTPSPTPAPTACFNKMMELCGGAALGQDCEVCLTQHSQQVLAPGGPCSQQQYGGMFLPFCTCHQPVHCTPAPAPTALFYTPQPTRCDVCPGLPGSICCDPTLHQICYSHSGKDLGKCCDCQTRSCSCGPGAAVAR
eukprot:TRINITY_DN70030_c0_g1_i1.p1 TRINITY_DN70030_c0_g1~~TRINITY_DN70030_c0_g1_i1.p1  ORF type:complete len:394 (+),score=108.81 TRINITY_DN70030_c0_g1_i1:77-1258(+)